MVLIGDGSHARLFRIDASQAWKLEQKFDREHSREKTSRDDSREDRGEHGFAQQLVAELETGRQKGDFEQLVIVAPPKFLGQLRAELGAPLAACVVKTHAHDYTHMAEAELAERVTLS